MSTRTDSEAAAPAVNYLELVFALFGGATVWLVRLVANSALVTWSCGIGSTWPLWLVTGVTTAVGLAALWSSWRLYKLADQPEASAETARWLGLLGILFNVTSVIGILFESAPILVLDVCRAVVGA